LGSGHRTHIRRLLKWGNNVVTCSSVQRLLPPKLGLMFHSLMGHCLDTASLSKATTTRRRSTLVHLLKRLCNFTLTTTICIMKSNQQAWPATERVLVAGTAFTHDLAAVVYKNALCCQKFSPLEIKSARQALSLSTHQPRQPSQAAFQATMLKFT
jgi:hypothetical protein